MTMRMQITEAKCQYQEDAVVIRGLPHCASRSHLYMKQMQNAMSSRNCRIAVDEYGLNIGNLTGIIC
jgi:hypothetical protein